MHKRLYHLLIPAFLVFAVSVVSAAEKVMGETVLTRSVSIVDLGAVGDGITLNTTNIQMAIDQLAAAGGGTVVVPNGVFLTGAIFCKPKVNLHLEKGAVLKGSTDMKYYPERRIRIEGHFEEYFASGLINAEGCDGLRIDGEGTLDGNGRPTWDRFWQLARTTKQPKKVSNSTISRPQLCIINNSKNVTVEGVTFKDSAFWNLHLYQCRNVTVRQVRFQVPDGYKRAPSTDGIDVDSCQDVEIDGCYFSVTDDCVCLKGSRYDGLNQEPPSPPVRNVLVKNCIFNRGDGAVTFGSEAQSISGVEMKDCVVRGKMPMLRIKFRPDTANQDYQNVHVHDIKLEGTQGEIVRVSPYHGTKVPTPKAPISKVSGIVIENISGTFGAFGTLAGGTTATVSDVTLRNIHVTVAKDSELNTNGVCGLKLEDVMVTKRPEFNTRGVEDVKEQTRKFENGALTDHVPWLDTAGNLINAHDGGIIFAEGKYHWYGMALRPMSVKDGGQKTTTGVVMYSSTNLYDWTYEGVILECSKDPKSPLYGPMRFERPKIIYNDHTKTYVMWFHYVQRPGDHTQKPGGGEAGVASCRTVNGKYTFHGTVRPIDNRGIVRDCTLFKDEDGSAYFIYDRDIRIPGPDFGRVLHIVKLSDDYLAPTTNAYEIDTAAGREAPVMIKRNGFYFLVTSGLTSWDFNRAKYFRAKNILGPYTDMGDPCVGESTETTFNTQGTYAFPVQGKPDEVIFLCERHDIACMTDSSFIFLPVYFPTSSTLQLRYVPEWKWEAWPGGTAESRMTNSRDAVGKVSITQFGAIDDGVTLNTANIQRAIDQVAAAGGGTVVVPKGVFLTGALFLEPGVNLHLEKDAVIKGSTDMSNYPKRRIRIEGHFEEGYSSGLINAEGCDGLRIDGEGTLDGNGRSLWDRFWELRRASSDPKNFKNINLPRAQLCIINNSKNVVVEGVTFKDSQYWNLHLYDCRTVLVQNARFLVPDNYKQAPSTDGIDVDSCQYVAVKGCFFSVTDDCIAMKGSKGPDALKDKASPPVEHVRVSDCTFKRGNGVTLGSEATIVRDVLVENCRFTGFVPVLNFKLRPDTPQHYEDIHYRDITLDGSGTILRVQPWTQYYNLNGYPPPKSVVRDVSLSNLKGQYGDFGTIQGNSGQTDICDITLENIDVQLNQGRLKVGKVANLKVKNVRVNGRPYALDVANRPVPSNPGDSSGMPAASKISSPELTDKSQG